LAHIAEGLDGKGLSADDVPDDFDLLAEGVVDSFGLVELINALEARFGIELDFENMDADELSLVGPFSRFVETCLVNANGGQLPSQAAPTERPSVRAPTPITDTVLPDSTGTRRIAGRAAIGLYRQGIRARDKLFSLAVGGSFRSFGANTVIQLPVRLKNERRIAIGSGCFVGAGSWLQVLDGTSDGPAIVIGDGFDASGHCVLSAVESIRIGRNVSVARNVYVSDHTHVYDDTERAVLDQGTTPPESVEIGDGAWLGENVMVFPGVRIGRGAVVGANSVVTSDVPDFSLAAGAPARVVRRFGPAARPG
jgi:acetyltransferase-like isoleucine patch superfamily enzyme/acyl carrier protein